MFCAFCKSLPFSSLFLKVKIKFLYKTQILDKEKLSLDNLTIKFNFEREDGVTQTIVANPATQDSILHYLVLLIYFRVGLFRLICHL